jgi:Skp family chaperone for outer membrane proteins
MAVPFPDRRPVVLAVLGGLLLAAAPAGALEGIGVIDYQSVFDQFEGTTDAQQTLDREIKEWEKEMRDLRTEIDALDQEIASQRLMLSEERLREKETSLDEKKREYERFAQDVFGVNGRASKRNAELTAPIAEKILDVIAKIGEERGLSIVLDAGSGGVVWARDDVNITQFVLDDLRISVQPDVADTTASAPPDSGRHD